jgi:Uma2 family endonuclease
MDWTEPRPLRLTAGEYYQLCESGVLRGRRVQLSEGEVVETAAQHNVHLAAITLTADALRGAFGPGYWVRVQGSLDLSPHSVPDPDLAVIVGTPRTCTQNNPTSALLAVEVSDTTLAYDRRVKASLYAAAGVADSWVVNIPDRQLEVHRDPVPDAGQAFRFRYNDRTVLLPGDSATPLALPGALIPVADLLP